MKKTAVILTGGRSLRFGRDKAQARWQGLTLLERVIQSVGQAGFEVFLAGRQVNLPGLTSGACPDAACGWPVGAPPGLTPGVLRGDLPRPRSGREGEAPRALPAEGATQAPIMDPYPWQGPLQALFGVWNHILAEKILLTACDMPFVKPDVLNFLWKRSLSFDVTLFYSPDRVFTLPAVYSKKAGQEAGRLFQKGSRDLKSLLNSPLSIQKIGLSEIKEMDSEGISFVNINRPDDLECQRGRGIL